MEEVREAALRGAMLAVGRRDDCARVSRVNAEGTLIEVESREGEIFRLELKGVAATRRTGGAGGKA